MAVQGHYIRHQVSKFKNSWKQVFTMKCPNCGAVGRTRVLDTGPDATGDIRRRRECTECNYRFNTLERVLVGTPLLVKADGRREAFDRDKLIRGIRIACAKRSVAAIDIDRLVNSIEERLQQMGRAEVPSRIVGDMVIDGLKELDPIAYIRYAIVYLRLDNLKSVRDEIDRLLIDEDDNLAPTT